MRVYQFRHVGLLEALLREEDWHYREKLPEVNSVRVILTAGIALGEYRSSPLHYPLNF